MASPHHYLTDDDIALIEERAAQQRHAEAIATLRALPPDLLEWAIRQPEGFSGLCQRLLAAERQRLKSALSP